MKSFPLTLFVVCLFIICVLSIGPVVGLSQNEASVSLLWSSTTVYRGDLVSVRITFENQSPEQLRIYRIGLHFDWMSPNEFYTKDLSDQPVTVPGNGIHVFQEMSIQIPATVSVGSHSFFVGVDGTAGMDAFSWDSPTSTMQINARGEVHNDNDEPIGETSSWMFYLVIAIIAVIIPILIIAFIVKIRRKPTDVAAEVASFFRPPSSLPLTI
jgi:hypothetical protein